MYDIANRSTLRYHSTLKVTSSQSTFIGALLDTGWTKTLKHETDQEQLKQGMYIYTDGNEIAIHIISETIHSEICRTNHNILTLFEP